jgi:ferredoxin-NADP reductase
MSLKKTKLIEKIQLTHDVVEFIFECKKKCDFEAGQFINFKIDDNGEFPCFRAYSICSAPNSKAFVICIKLVENGRGTAWLNSLNEGDEVEFLGPTGKFLFEEGSKKYTFIATGTGVAPFKSMIEDQLSKGNKAEIQLLFGVRSEEDIFYKEFFEELEKKHENFKFHLALSRPPESWKGVKGRVTKALEEIELDTKNTTFYICGLKNMIEDVETLLLEKGVVKEAIRFEKYD